MTVNSNIPKMLTINEIAEVAGLAKFYIRQLCINKKIVCVKAGRKFLINLEKLIEFLNSGDLNV